MAILSEALQKLLGLAEREGTQEGASALERQAAHRADAEALNSVNESTVPRDAASSAAVFNDSAPNFELQGPPRTEAAPGAQNFQLQGDPYSGNVPANMSQVPATRSSPPAVRTEALSPEVLNPEASTTGSIDVTPKSQAPQIGSASPQAVEGFLSKYGNKAAIPAALGAAALGTMSQSNRLSGVPPKGPTDDIDNDEDGDTDEEDKKTIAADNKDVNNEDDTDEDEDTVDKSKKPADKTPNQTNKQQTGEEAPKQSNTQDLANMLGQQTEATKGQLSDAQHQRDISVLANQLGKAGEVIGSSVARTAPVAQHLFDQNINLANQGVVDLKDRIALEEKDPNSDVSVNYRNFLKKYGVNVPENVSAEQVKSTLLPAAEKEQLLKERLQQQKDLKEMQTKMLAQKREETNAYKDRNRQDKIDFKDRAEGAQVAKEMNGLSASSRSALGQAITAKTKAQRLIGLLQDPGTTAQDYNTAAADMSSIVSGTATIGGAKDQQYNSLKKDLARGLQYLSSSPKAVDTPLIKQHIINVTNKMMQISDEVQNHQLRIVKAGHHDFFARRPEIVNDIMGQIQNGSETPTQQPEAPHEGKYPPGSVVNVQGKNWVVGDDGDTLNPQ